MAQCFIVFKRYLELHVLLDFTGSPIKSDLARPIHLIILFARGCC